MRKLAYIGISSFVLLFTSCMEEIDNWYTNTSDFDGRFVVATTCEEYSSDNTTIADGNELMIYNSAANIENEIIIDTHVAGHAIKGKFKVTGNTAEFTAAEVADNLSRSSGLSDDDFYVLKNGAPDKYPSGLGDPESAGIEHEGVQLYSRLSLGNGKIIPKAATTIGGNVSDSVYVETTMYFDLVTIESYQIPEADWSDPNEPEYDWRVKAGSRTNAAGWEEHWTLAGYRYTGFPEDVNPKVPIIEN
ncbi:MAG: lipid-binding protein [Prolixibacteraceae bacterium]